MNNLKIVTLNVRGIRDKKKRLILINWLKRKKFDIVCLQETFITEEILPNIEEDFHELGNFISSCTNSFHSRGVGIILANNRYQWNIQSIHRDTEGRKVLVNVLDQNSKLYSISSLYVPNNLNLRIQFINECNGWLQNQASNKNTLILAGDLNTCYDAGDRASGRLEKSGDSLKQLITKNNLIDTFRLVNPEAKGYTYIHNSDNLRNSRLDYILVSSTFLQAIHSSSIFSSPAPDHKALSVNFCFSTNRRGNGYWKLNNSLLLDDSYKEIIKSDILDAINTYGLSISKQELFDYIKVIVKESSIKYSACKKSQKNVQDIPN